MMMEDLHADCVVVGGGAAGLFAALRAADSAEVVVITKRGLSDSTTSEAQGGIAVSLGEEDNASLHAEDTLAAGAGLCEKEAVDILVREGIERVQDLLTAGAGFDRQDGQLAFSREAAHSRRRVVRARGDATGREVQRVLAEKALRHPHIKILEHTAAQQLMLDDGVCRGVVSVNLVSGEHLLLTGAAVVLATGGAGQLFARTTNPEVVTGDGMALAFQAGAELMDMEFVQFHPTVLFLPGAPAFLISEAVRGDGAVLKNVHGEAFMEKYHPDRELAPRDIVSRSVLAEMRATNSDFVWLDLTEIKGVNLLERFPTIGENCLRFGLDIRREPIPVAPAAHYLMGGIRTDLWGRTGRQGLLACGECACVGLHGANRLASNSILEGLVFGHRAGQAAAENNAPGHPLPERLRTPESPFPGAQAPSDSQASELQALRGRLQTLMWEKVGLVRCRESLVDAEGVLAGIASRLAPLTALWQGAELWNMTALSQAIVRCALTREESRGAHFRTDFPLQDDVRWAKHSLVRLINGAASVSAEDADGVRNRYGGVRPATTAELDVSFAPVGEGVLRALEMAATPGRGTRCLPETEEKR
jgi:L-aspartate oxidase